MHGNYACQSPYLVTTTLRDLWGFPGFVTSDYGALHSTSGALAGTDQEQPFNTYFGTPAARRRSAPARSRARCSTRWSRGC